MSAGVKVELRECGEPAEICAVPDLQPDIVTVWIRTLEVSPALERSCYELLSSEERERAARYRVGKPRDNFILTRGTLRSLVATCVGAKPQELSFRYSEYGKPLLDGSFDLHFNVSHTDGLALIALGKTREIGVDVEKITAAPDFRKLAARFFSARERDSLEQFSGKNFPQLSFVAGRVKKPTSRREGKDSRSPCISLMSPWLRMKLRLYWRRGRIHRRPAAGPCETCL